MLQSKDVVSVATLFASIFMLRLVFVGGVTAIRELFYHCLSYAAQVPFARDRDFFGDAWFQALITVAKTAAPMLLATMFVAIAVTLYQTKLLVSWELVKPKFSKINPLQGLKRLFSLRSLIEAVKGLLKISILLYLIYSCLTDLIPVVTNYLHTGLNQAIGDLLGRIFSMMLKVGMAFVALAAFDFLYQWWEFERQLKMSKQEIKEEYKQLEGDPQIKGKIREIQRKMSQARMMQQVPKADVIIRNPTHYAVALRYKAEEDAAPVVLAKGQDALAMRIVKVAEEHSIAVIENVPLARALYADAELNREIPTQLYGAVAEVLVYLYKLNSKHS